MFFSEHDIDRMAYYAWLWDTDHRLTTRSWESVKAQYRDRATFLVEALNNNLQVAA